MKRSLVVVTVLLSIGLGSCQCADEPDVGPVEGEEEDAQAVQVETMPPSHFL